MARRSDTMKSSAGGVMALQYPPDESPSSALPADHPALATAGQGGPPTDYRDAFRRMPTLSLDVPYFPNEPERQLIKRVIRGDFRLVAQHQNMRNWLMQVFQCPPELVQDLWLHHIIPVSIYASFGQPPLEHVSKVHRGLSDTRWKAMRRVHMRQRAKLLRSMAGIGTEAGQGRCVHPANDWSNLAFIRGCSDDGHQRHGVHAQLHRFMDGELGHKAQLKKLAEEKDKDGIATLTIPYDPQMLWLTEDDPLLHWLQTQARKNPSFPKIYALGRHPALAKLRKC